MVLPEVLGDDAVGRPDEPDDLLTAAARIRGRSRLGQGVDIDVTLRQKAIEWAALVMGRRRDDTRKRGRRRVAKRRLAQPGPDQRRAAGGSLNLGDRMLENQRREKEDNDRQGERPPMGG